MDDYHAENNNGVRRGDSATTKPFSRLYPSASLHTPNFYYVEISKL